MAECYALDIIEKSIVEAQGNVAAALRLIQEQLGGESWWISSAKRGEIEERNRHIQQIFNGRNYEEICTMFDISRRQLHRILQGK